MTNWRDKAEGLDADLGFALTLLERVARGETGMCGVAWWLCANYRDRVVGDTKIMDSAEVCGPPPKGDWVGWWEEARATRRERQQ
jgi:hypothetical protein